MSWLGSRSVRIYADDDPQADAVSRSPTTRGDYAALLQRGRRKAHGDPRRDRANAKGGGATAHSGHGPSHGSLTADADAHDDSHADAESPAVATSLPAAPGRAEPGDGDGAAARTDTASPTDEKRLERIAAPYLDALIEQRRQFLRLVDYLADRVADFCTDPAIVAQGHWEIRMTLDPALLPACALHLRLSHFDLTLRFDAEDPVSKHLVLNHCEVLKTRLEALLAQHDTPRSVEIIVG